MTEWGEMGDDSVKEEGKGEGGGVCGSGQDTQTHVTPPIHHLEAGRHTHTHTRTAHAFALDYNSSSLPIASNGLQQHIGEPELSSHNAVTHKQTVLKFMITSTHTDAAYLRRHEFICGFRSVTTCWTANVVTRFFKTGAQDRMCADTGLVTRFEFLLSSQKCLRN